MRTVLLIPMTCLWLTVAGLPGTADARSPTLVELQRRLKGMDVRERQAAARVIRNHGRKAVPALRGALKDTSARVREVAASSLEAIFALNRKDRGLGAKTLPRLVELLKDSDPFVRCEAAGAISALGARGASAIPALARLLALAHRKVPPRVPPWNRRPCELGDALASALGKMGHGGLPSLRPLLGHDNARVRAWSARALGASGAAAASATPALTVALGDRDPGVRRAAASALAAVGPAAASAVSALIGALSDAVMAVRGEAINALGEIGPGARSAAKALIRLIRKEPRSWVRAAAVSALARIYPGGGRPALAVFLRCLADRESSVRDACAAALGPFGKRARAAVPRLLRLVRGKKPSRAAIATLGKLSDRRAFGALVRSLKAPDDLIRKEAAVALGKLGSPRAIAPLHRAYGIEREPHVKEEIITALASFGARARDAAAVILARTLKEGFLSRDRMRTATLLMGTGLDARLIAIIGRACTDSKRSMLAGSVCSRGPDPAPLIKALAHGDPMVQVGATHCLGGRISRYEPAVITALVRALAQGHVASRRAAAGVLLPAIGRTPAVVKGLLSALGDTDADVRRTAAETLEYAVVAASVVVPALERLRGDSSEGVRKAAATSLARIKARIKASKRGR